MKKVLFIILFFILFILLFQLDVFAAEISFEDNSGTEITTSLPEDLSSTDNYFIAQAKSSVFLISTDKYNVGLYFSTFDVYTNYNEARLYTNQWLYNYDTNSFGTKNNNFYFGGGGRHPSSDFSILYCSTDFYVYCEHDDDGLFSDNEILGYDSNYSLNITSEYTDNSYRLYTNYFSPNGIQPYWTAYIWTLSEEEYKPLEECSPIEGSGWVSFDNYETKVENDINYVRYYYDVTDIKEYTVCFTNSLTNKYHYFTVDPESSTALNLHLSTTEKTTDPIYVLSNRYYYEGNYDIDNDFLQDFEISVSYGYDNPYEATSSPLKFYDEEKQMYYTEYQYKIVINGIYNFKIYNKITGKTTYQTFNIDNIGVDNKWGEDIYYDNYNDKGEFDPTPVLFLEYVDNFTVRIRTQPFIFNEFILLNCYFSSDGSDYEELNTYYTTSLYTDLSGRDSGGFGDRNTGGWSGGGRYNGVEGEIISGDILEEDIITTYYFYKDIMVDGTYYFKFYNIELDKYTVASIEVNISDFLSSNVNNIDSFSNKMVVWAREHLGLLYLPFEIIFNLFSRITTINFTVPTLVIPELRDPFTNTVILNSYTYNFNSLLSISVVNTIHEIYLIIVDCILFFLFINLCFKVFKEVFT